MTEQPSGEVERISVAPLIRAGGDEFAAALPCPTCGHHLREVCECGCHLPWDDTRWVKVGAG